MSRRSSARSTSCSGRSIADRPPVAFVSAIGDSHMTETLAEKTCTPCRGGVPPLGRDEALRFQAQAPDWELRDEAHRIERTFRFRNQAHGRQPLLVKAAHSEAEQVITRIHI